MNKKLCDRIVISEIKKKKRKWYSYNNNNKNNNNNNNNNKMWKSHIKTKFEITLTSTRK